jgi:cell division topological specificity factor
MPLTSLIDYFLGRKKSSAATAKERLQILVAHERANRGTPDYLPALQKEILEVICKYIPIDKNQIKMQFDRIEGCDVMEVNVLLPELKK